jgi:hypothetical protein
MSARQNDPAVIRASIEHIDKVGRWLQQALWGITGGSLVFTCLTVTLFGVKHGVPWFIAWLLEPLVALALIAVLLGDGVLSHYGERAPGWAILLRWFAGLASWTMNVWASVFPSLPEKASTGTGLVGAKFHPDVAGIVLHSIVPLLVILLAESAPRYRRRFSIIAEQLRDRLAKVEGTASGRPAVPTKPLPDRATEPRTVPSAKPATGGSVQPNRAIATPRPSQATVPAVPSTKPLAEPAKPVTVPSTEPVPSGTAAGDRANQATTEPDSGEQVPPEVRPGVKPPDYVIDAARKICMAALDDGREMKDRKLATLTRDHFNAPHPVIGRSACASIIAEAERAEETG